MDSLMKKEFATINMTTYAEIITSRFSVSCKQRYHNQIHMGIIYHNKKVEIGQFSKKPEVLTT